MGSVSGIYTPPFFGPYSSSKHALEALTDALRQELAPWGVHVSIVEAGVIWTPIWKKGFRTIDDVRAELPERGRRLHDPFLSPMRRTFEGEVEDGIPPETVAKAVAHTVRSPRPKTLYVVGRDARVNPERAASRSSRVAPAGLRTPASAPRLHIPPTLPSTDPSVPDPHRR